jgi:tripartite-type tricarboxylate transporter receptor subunit TctC
VPKERLDALRRAFEATAKDPEFLADAEKTRVLIDVVSGEEIIAELKKVYATPRSVIERIKSAIK